MIQAGPASGQISVTTRAYDGGRTGWNSNETILTPDSVSGTVNGLRFEHLPPDTDISEPDDASGPIYNQVDAQPLVVHGIAIDPSPGGQPPGSQQPPGGRGAGGPGGPGAASAGNAVDAADRDVVYIVTEANFIYAIDGETGRILKRRRLNHKPVNYPNGCLNNAATVGITSTPVIDTHAQVMFLIAYADTAHGHVYYLHKISLSTLDDLPDSPVEIKASARLPNGETIPFDATYQRQRAALLLHNGLIYAGFASFCDEPRDKARGWLMAWYADTLRPFALTNDAGAPAPFLVNQTSAQAAQEFLSGIWMSGAGPASDDSGDVYFITGNSSRAPITYRPGQNLAESFIRYSPWDKKVVSFFTPANVSELEENDQDFGAGGPVLVPGHLDGMPGRLALAAGKDGRLYVLDRDDLGGFRGGADGGDKALGVAQTTGEGEECRCNVIVQPGAKPLVAIGAGTNLSLFRLSAAPGGPLQLEARGELVDDKGETANSPFGFGITGSSNGTDDAIVWAVSRPGSSSDAGVYLYAFDGVQKQGKGAPRLLTRQYAGYWPFTYATTGVVPVVANGKVYVATMGKVMRFGLTPTRANQAGGAALALGEALSAAGPTGATGPTGANGPIGAAGPGSAQTLAAPALPAARGILPARARAGAPGGGTAAGRPVAGLPSSGPSVAGATAGAAQPRTVSTTILGEPTRQAQEEPFQVPLPRAFSTRLTGFVTELAGARIRIKTIMHQEFRVDISAAMAKHRLPVVFQIGTPVQILGDTGHDPKGVVVYGRVVNDAGTVTKLWEPDVIGNTSG